MYVTNRQNMPIRICHNSHILLPELLIENSTCMCGISNVLHRPFMCSGLLRTPSVFKE